MICSRPGCNANVDGKRFCPVCGTKVNAVSCETVMQEQTLIQDEEAVNNIPQDDSVQSCEKEACPAEEPKHEAAAAADSANNTSYNNIVRQPQAPAYCAAAPVENVVTTGQWFGIMLLMTIPLINILMLIIWACSAKRKSLANYAKASLIWMLVGSIISIGLVVFGVTVGREIWHLISESSEIAEIIDKIKDLIFKISDLAQV